MQLTQQHIDQMKAQGLTIDKIQELAHARGDTLPPVSTAPQTDLLGSVTKGVNSVFAGGKVGEAIGTLGGLAWEKTKGLFGGQDNSAFYDTSAPSPLQVVGDIAKGAVQVAGAKLPVSGSVLGKVGQFGALGAASGATDAVAQGKSSLDVAKQATHEGIIGGLTGLTFGVLEKGVKALTGVVAKGGEKIQSTVIKPSAADLKDGFSIENVNKYGLGGNLQQTAAKTAKTMSALSAQLREKLTSSNASINLNSAFDKTVSDLVGNKMEHFGTNAQMDGAIEKLRQEIIAVAGGNGVVSVPEAQTIKQAAGYHGAWSFENNDPAAKASEKVYNAFYHHIKTSIEEGSPVGVREINKQLSELIPVMNAVIRRIPVAERNGAISLTDIISMTAATMEPSALLVTLANRAAKSGRVGAFLAKQGNLGQGAMKGAEQIAQSVTSH